MRYSQRASCSQNHLEAEIGPKRPISPAEIWSRTELFFGSASPNGTVVDDAELTKFVDEEVTRRFPDGLTLLTGYGQFKNSAGTISREKSFVLILFYPAQTIDANVDVWIDLSELSGFHADFRVEDGSQTNWSFSGLQAGGGFFFSSPGDFLLLVGNADWTLVNTAFEGEVLGSIFDQFLFPLVETQALPVVTPEPSGALLFAIAAAAGGLYRYSAKHRTGTSIAK